MNLQYLRYALEISRTGSISKAAENLSVAQPNLSRAVKELESGLGIAIFDRTRTGMTVTPEGERLLSAGERILRDVDELETMFDSEEAPRQTLTLTTPASAYISHALARLCRDLPTDERYDIVCRESTDAMGMVTRGESRLGILRYPVHFEAYYADLLARRELSSESIADLSPVLIAGQGSPLASMELPSPTALSLLCRVDDPDGMITDTAEASPASAPRRLTLASEPARLELLAADPGIYTISLPLPPVIAARYGLLQRRPPSPMTPLRDVLIFPKHYRLSPLDRTLLGILREIASTCGPTA